MNFSDPRRRAGAGVGAGAGGGGGEAAGCIGINVQRLMWRPLPSAVAVPLRAAAPTSPNRHTIHCMKRLAVILALLLIVACRKAEAPAAPETASSAPPPATTSTEPAATLAPDAPIPASGVALWLIADEAGTGRLDSWTNALVAGVTAKAVSADAQPSIAANAINGHAVVHFDGENDMLMTNVDIGPARMPDATVIAVFRSNTSDSSPLRKLYGDDDGGYDRAAGLDDRAEDQKNYTLFTGMGVTGYFQLAADTTYLTVDQFSPKEFSGWVNGKAVLSKTAAAWGEDALPNLYLGGTGTVFSEFWKGDLAEIIVYARHLNDAERMRVEEYLAGRYQITLDRR